MDNELLYKYFTHRTTPEESHEVRLWVEASDENYNRFLSERKFFDTTMILASEPCDTCTTGYTENRGVKRFATTLMRLSVRAAAVAAIAATAIAGYLHFTPDSFNATAIHSLDVPAGQRLHVELADGTTVWLNSNTSMTISETFANGDRRLVDIDGEAYFNVAKDPERPFIVNTSKGSVTVTGTTFNVDAYSSSDIFSVSLIEGAVNVGTGNCTYKLIPGERIEITESVAAKGKLQTEDFEWINGIVSFRNLPLDKIISRFEKYYGVSVRFQCSHKIATTCFSGKFYIDEGIEQALNALQRDVRFSYEFDKDSRSVVIK